MRVINYVLFAFLTPTPSTALVQSSSGIRSRGLDLTSSDAAKEDGQWWPHRGGSGNRPVKQELENVGDAQYFGKIEVGGQQVKAVLDTGSFELLVFGANCTICGAAEDLYNSSKSKSSTEEDFEGTHSFGSGTTYSKKASDKVKIGRTSIHNQSFWEVYDAEMFILSEGRFQAIVGIGPPSSAVRFAMDDDREVHREIKELKKAGREVTQTVKEVAQHYDEMLAYMQNLSSVSKNLNVSNMSMCLGQESGSPGYFVWDDDATRKAPGKFTTVTVHGDTYWSTPMKDAYLTGGSVSEGNASKQLKRLATETVNLGCSKKKCSAVIDSGTTLLVAPAKVVDAIYDLADEWEAAGGSCEDISELPELRFKLDGVDMSLPPEAYMGEVSGAPDENLAKYMPRFLKKHEIAMAKRAALAKKYNTTNQDPDSLDDSYLDDRPDDVWMMCAPLIMSIDSQTEFGDLWILGMPFFRKYYTTFHFNQEGSSPEAARMSFSEQDGKCRPGVAPQAIDGKQKDIIQETLKRRSQLKIDAGKIFVPSLVGKAERKAKIAKQFKRSGV